MPITSSVTPSPDAAAAATVLACPTLHHDLHSDLHSGWNSVRLLDEHGFVDEHHDPRATRWSHRDRSD